MLDVDAVPQTYVIDNVADLDPFQPKGSGTLSDPYVIGGLEGDYRFSIRSFDRYLVIKNSTFSGAEGLSDHVIDVIDSSHLALQTNHFAAVERAIRIRNSSSIHISGNVFSTSSTGIEITHSQDIAIVSNHLAGSSGSGILLDDVAGLVNNNVISGFTTGILIEQATMTITNNDIVQNSEFGIYLGIQARDNRVVWNNLENQLQSQATDNGVSNFFEGNYWSDLVSPDNDGDGVVDRPYPLNGTASNQDHAPHTGANVVNLHVPQEYLEEDQQFPPWLIPIIIFVVLISIVIEYIQRRLLRIKLDRLSEWAVYGMIGSAPGALLGIINEDWSDVEERFDFQIPKELYQYKKLLHPVRLSILIALFESQSAISSDLRKDLELSWGMYTHGISTLGEMGYLREETQFVDGGASKRVSITYEGEQVYHKLRELLSTLFKF